MGDQIYSVSRKRKKTRCESKSSREKLLKKKKKKISILAHSFKEKEKLIARKQEVNTQMTVAASKMIEEEKQPTFANVSKDLDDL